MNQIEVYLDEIETNLNEMQIEQFVQSVLEKMGVDQWQLSISFITSQHIHDLNREFRNVDRPTDVITFNLNQKEDEFPQFPGEDDFYLPGDSVVCLDEVCANAKENGISKTEELQRVLIHSMLHLNMETHDSYDFSVEPMLIKQEKILKDLRSQNGEEEWTF